MEHARVENGQVVEIRNIPYMPPHKAALWKSIERTGSGPLETVSIDGDVVRIVRSMAPVSVADVAAERDRRLGLGFDYNFGDARGVHHIGTTEADLKGWSEVSTYAGALIDSGDMATTIAIATDTGPCLVTAPEWRAIEIAAAQFRQPLWGKSFALMAMNPIPQDYKNNAYWS